MTDHFAQAHTTERNITCDQCPKLFSTESLQREHSRRAHNSEKMKFPCDLCEKVFGRRHGLKDHIVRIHSELEKFCCDYCNKSFKVERVLKKHIEALHEKTFTPTPCKVCGKMLRTRVTQQFHSKAHIEIETQKVNCKRCPKMLKPSRLAKHMKRHELIPTTCNICNKKVIDLKRHQQTHFAQIKAHQCDVCKKGFETKARLLGHQLIHTTEKPFQCPQPDCSKSFNNSGSRYRHATVCMKIENKL